MKKYILVLLLAVISSATFAQKGMQSFGVDMPYSFGRSYDTYGFGLKYHYHVGNRDRIEVQASYRPLGSEGVEEWEIGVANHFFFNGIKRCRPYLVAGLSVGSLVWEDYYYSSGYDYYEWEDYITGILRAGLGLDIRLSHRWAWQLEVAGQIDFEGVSGGLVKTGFSYNF